MIKSQARMLASLWWWVRRRHQDLGPGDIAIGYAREQVPMLIAFAGVMALETAVVGLLVPWPIIHVLDGFEKAHCSKCTCRCR